MAVALTQGTDNNLLTDDADESSSCYSIIAVKYDGGYRSKNKGYDFMERFK
jgi:hypothetical protein